jgi:branched-chain amino acid transport system permease protein
MSTVAAGIVLDNVVLFTYGKEPRMLPSMMPDVSYIVGDLIIMPLQIAIPVVGLLAGASLHLYSRYTKQGRAMRAVVQNPDSSRLVGINVSTIIVISFVISTVFAGIAGILIAPLFNVSSDMGTLFGIKAFAVAILGGITSAWGVMVAGILYGIIEALITALFGSPYTHILTFTMVIVVLAIMPNGLFGRAEVKKV